MGSTPASRTNQNQRVFTRFLTFPDVFPTASDVKRRKPIVVRAGNAQVRIYTRTQTKASGEYRVFEVADYSGGKRKLLSFADEAEARTRANEIAVRMANLEGAVLTLRSRDRESYVRALETLKPAGVELDVAVAQFAEAHARLGGRSIAEAVSFFVAKNPTKLPPFPVADAVAAMLKAKEADGASPAYLKDLRSRLGEFAEDFGCDMADVNAPALNAWLREGWTGRNRNNYRTALVTLFKWAEAEGRVLANQLDFAKVAKAKEDDFEIEIFKPQEMAKLLQAVQVNPEDLPPGYNKRHALRSGLLAMLVLGGFAGMRTAEIQRQKWEDVNLERGFIRVTAGKGGTASKRLIPISDNLRAWLSVCDRESDVCCDYPRPWDALSRVARRAGVEWKHNALRHSFVSYRVALAQNVSQVALESGNSPRMIFQHYRELVTTDEAKAWFSILPSPPGDVLLLPTP